MIIVTRLNTLRTVIKWVLDVSAHSVLLTREQLWFDINNVVKSLIITWWLLQQRNQIHRAVMKLPNWYPTSVVYPKNWPKHIKVWGPHKTSSHELDLKLVNWKYNEEATHRACPRSWELRHLYGRETHVESVIVQNTCCAVVTHSLKKKYMNHSRRTLNSATHIRLIDATKEHDKPLNRTILIVWLEKSEIKYGRVINNTFCLSHKSMTRRDTRMFANAIDTMDNILVVPKNWRQAWGQNQSLSSISWVDTYQRRDNRSGEIVHN